MGARQRRWAAALVALALAASAVIAVAIGHGGAGDRPAASAARAYPTVPTLGAPREPDAVAVGGRSSQERAALKVARRFLAGYLPYSYGQAPASGIQGAARPLARTLRRQPPRVAASERGRAPRLGGLEVASING